MDVAEVIRISNKHPRVNILQPGPGVGGHCIPVDPWFLVGDYPETANFIRLALQTNAGMPEYVLHRAHEVMAERGIDPVEAVGFGWLPQPASAAAAEAAPSTPAPFRKLRRESSILYHPSIAAVLDLTAFTAPFDMSIVARESREVNKQ